MLRIPRCLDNRVIDGGDVVALRSCRALIIMNTFLSVSDTHFCWRLSKPQVLVRLEELVKTFNDLIITQTHDLPACSVAPQPTTLPRALLDVAVQWIIFLLSILEFSSLNLGPD
jgi:hypothetical protein